MSEPAFEEEWIECHSCNGTGIDDSDWSGRCASCSGSGERLARHYACDICSEFGCDDDHGGA